MFHICRCTQTNVFEKNECKKKHHQFTNTRTDAEGANVIPLTLDLVSEAEGRKNSKLVNSTHVSLHLHSLFLDLESRISKGESTKSLVDS